MALIQVSEILEFTQIYGMTPIEWFISLPGYIYIYIKYIFLLGYIVSFMGYLLMGLSLDYYVGRPNMGEI